VHGAGIGLDEDVDSLSLVTGRKMECVGGGKCWLGGPSPSIRVFPFPKHSPPNIPLHWGVSSLGRTKGFSSHWCPTKPSSATYAAGAMGLSMSLGSGLVPGSSGWLVLLFL